MACSRGKAAPDEQTKLRLFSASGGYCQNPACQRELFIDTGTKRIHIAEMAHVFAASDGGARTNTELSEAERGAFENLILLCSACHTIIDKAEADYPATLITGWKRNHSARLAQVFGAVTYESRTAVRAAIEPLMTENEVIHAEYNPDLDYRYDPESELSNVWQKNMIERIIPNSRRILATLDANRKLSTKEEKVIIELFRQHLHDLEAKHLTDVVAGPARRFPSAMVDMMVDR